MTRVIRKAAVLGAGVMGSAIAAHLANAGIVTYLLDLGTVAAEAKKRLLKTKPAPLFCAERADFILPGNLEEDLSKIEDVDWVIEAIVEQLEIKKELFAKVEQHWRPGTIVSTNTSGVSIEAISRERGKSFQHHFLGTHFFNPPRYMKLLEIIPGSQTTPEVVNNISDFAEKKLGKGIVVARDTPNFIANRIGVFGFMVTLEEMLKKGFTTEEVDAMTGPLLGRPKSATFRTLDLVGLDTFVHVANNVRTHISDSVEKGMFTVPTFIEDMVKSGQLGDKSGRGFYWKQNGASGRDILTFNWLSKEYRSRKKVNLPAIEPIKSLGMLPQRLRALVKNPSAEGQFIWQILKRTLLYAAGKIPEIAGDPYSVDQGMKWGFNWELGPFEMWDALGLQETAKRMVKEGESLPEWVEKLLAAGRTSFYEERQGSLFHHTFSGEFIQEKRAKQMQKVADYRKKGKPIRSNTGASLYEIGEDVACLAFHSPNQAIGYDIIEMLHASVAEVEKNYRGLVIHHDGTNFCVGANLMMILMEAQDENWEEIETLVHRFQQANLTMKYAAKPVVVAPFGLTLGGGAEICLPSTRIQASAESYIGLVETGVGLIPAGGGTKELLLRNTEWIDERNGKVDLQPFVNHVFETIALGKVSTSGEEARSLGFLRKTDGITMNREYLLYDARQSVLALEQLNVEPPRKKDIRVTGTDGEGVLKFMIYSMKQSHWISDHDEKVARSLAHVLCGGNVPPNSYVSEQSLLDLEREAFLSLLGEGKTQERMQYMLLKGKPLRN